MAEDTRAVSSCRFSTRISLRWLPEPAHETTDTIVMSVKDWYLDLRMDKQTQKIDWAIAGQRIVESQEPLRVSFTHELDSHDAFESVDCGTFVSLPNGDDLETGSMPRPDLPGAPDTEYEEVWRELPFRQGPEGKGKGISWVLESDDGDLGEQEGEVTVVKTFLGRIWGTYLALQQKQVHARRKDASGGWVVSKTGAAASARREEWVGSGWEERYVVGVAGDELASMMTGIAGEGKGSWRVCGERVVVHGMTYIVRAFEEI
ncbi:uncharacterized protein N7484_010077 [Penicillium longicatenatum]|uniref:uncharacterized protein n=1 Tax=Penicillium longicatenatum TaxID=1561947 RepID=UPI0025497DAF|nr:uncharacterized protein N7484_010077 [Penicillium longicatenatum]KAJ5636764.1 hypothetical protein N7484_010077 [Penicillium longicatenatum]